MPSTYTTNLGIEKIGTGEQSGTWGTTTNTNFDLIDQAVNGVAQVVLASAGTSGSPNDLPVNNGSLSDGRNKFIEFTDGGDLGATAYVQLTPNDAEKVVFLRNSLTGGRSVIVFQGTYNASNDFEIPNGADVVLKFDGAGVSATVTQVFQDLTITAITLSSGTTVSSILDQDDMSSDSDTALATQQSIKAYVDSQVGTADTLSEILANGNTSGATDLVIDNGQVLTTNTINETTAASGVTIDSVLLKDDGVNATNLEITNIKANDGTSAGSIADSTGVVTFSSTILTTTDINGGTIDGTVIGGASEANATFVDVQIDSLGVGTPASGTTGEIRATNNVTAFYSDKRLKENINLISDALTKLSNISGVMFTPNEVAAKYGYDTSKNYPGVIAQEIKAVLPEAVVPAPFDTSYDEEGNEFSISGENYMTVQYEKLIPLLIEAIKELDKKVTTLGEK
jgi:hypothetical protein